MTAMKFEDQKLPDLDDYATLAEQFNPGRRAIFAIVEASFLELLARGPPAKILVVGAGGGEEILRLLRRIWKRHGVCNGIAEEVAESNAQNFKKVAVVSAERQEELLTAAGFKDLVPIFRGLAIKGWLAFA